MLPKAPDELPLDEILYQGFGGYHVLRNDKVFYWAEANLQWTEFKTLADIEQEARKAPEEKWEVILNNPLRGATWQRFEGRWLLTETNQEFA